MKKIKEFLKSNKKFIEIKADKIKHPKNMFLCNLRKMCFIILGKVPPSKIKNNLTRILGVKLGKDVCLPMDVMFDHIYPELIEVGDGTLIGGYSKLFCHEKKNGKYRIGRINIGKETLICGACRIGPGADIGEGAIIGGWSYMEGKAKDYEFWGGSPCKFLKELPKDWNHIDRSNTKKYYKDSRKAIKNYIKDKKRKEIFHVMYKGSRGNAGCDWYKVRSTTRIWLTSAWIEFCNLFFPPGELKSALFRLTGAKIGKGVKLMRNGYIDHIYPELVHLGDGVVIEPYSYVGTHDFTNNRSTVGRIIIGKNVHIGRESAIQPGISVGEGVEVEPRTFVNKDTPAHVCVGGIPGKIKDKIPKETTL